MDEYNAAMLILRVAFGLTMAAHGHAKVFKGGKLAGTAGWFDSIGMKPGAVHARLAAGTEILAGLGLALGLLTTFSAMGFVGIMLVAGYTVHRSNGFFIVSEGWEYTFILAIGAIGIAMLGPGEWSLDNAIGIDRDLDGWLGLVIAGAGGVAAGIAQLAIFYRPPASS
jgi:putative oxidoreductase